MKKQLLLILFSFLAVAGYARVITGTVISESDNEPVIGATVMVKGTQRGVATDFDGKFTLDVKDSDVLTITNVGMLQQDVKVGKQQSLRIIMKDNAQLLGEVVVTAMGQTQEKKKLNFAVQQLDSKEISAGVSNNLASTLQGKVSGLQILSTGGSPNASQTIQIRAISSINTSQNNEPLIIIDGVPVRGGGSSLTDINPNDIESMSVLKGAAASALYGQEAANGVIMIVTKSGKDGKLTVTANATLEISNAARVPEIQSSFAPGTKGFYVLNSGSGGWGAPLAAGQPTYDNVGDFLRTGFLQKYDISMTGGTTKANAYASVSYQKNEGVVPEDYKDQFNVFIKGNFEPSDKVKIQLSTSFKESKSRGFGNSMSSIYNWGITKNMSDYQTAEGYPNWDAYYDDWSQVIPSKRISAAISPYFGRYNDRSETTGTRIMLNGQISYEPIKNLVLTGKVSYDKGYSMYDAAVVPRFRQTDFEADADFLSEYQYKFGAYSFQPSRSERFNAQFLATYQRELFKDFNMNVLFGIDWTNYKSLSAQLAGQKFMLEGDFYSFQNIDPASFTNTSTAGYNMYLNHSQWNKYGYFGELRFDWKGIAQVSVTGRLDGSSTLRQVDYKYFYPSFTGGLIFSELFKIQSDIFSYGKIRGNWAKVGKSCTPYKFTESYKN